MLKFPDDRSYSRVGFIGIIGAKNYGKILEMNRRQVSPAVRVLIQARNDFSRANVELS